MKTELDLLNAQKVTLENMRKFIACHSTTFSETFKNDFSKTINESMNEIDIEIKRLESTNEPK